MSRRHPRRKMGGGRFARLPVAVLEHKAVQTLSHAIFRVLVLLAAEFRGFNNGALALTVEQARQAGIGSRHTLYAALRELEVRGLIVTTFPASRVPPRPTMYALTWLPIDDTTYSQSTRIASHEYRKWSLAASKK